MTDYKIISADSHASEPMELYERLPAEYRHRAPRIETRDGVRYYVFEGMSPSPIEAPNPLNEDDRRRFWRDGEEVGRVVHRAGGTDVPLRLVDQDEDGVSGEIIYPTGYLLTTTSPDPRLQLALARLYNDWYHEIFGDYSDRLVVSATIPILNIEDAIAEAKRAVKMGYRSLSIPMMMPALPYNQPHYEPFWSAVEEMGVPVSLHTFTQGPNTGEVDQEKWENPGEDMIDLILGLAGAMNPILRLIASGVLQRHPGLKIVLVECGIGWLAWLLQAMDEMHHKRHMWARPKLEMLPSEYFKRQGHLTFGDDWVGLHNREVTGVDCLMWGSDYPHDEGTFPHSREVIERTFKDVPEDEKRKIIGGNAARLYGFPMN